MSRFLVFCFDGTDNGRDDEFATNILRFHNLISQPHASHYFAGPGNEDENNWWGEFVGKAFGTGCDDIRDDGIRALESIYRPGDKIAVIGFSRGATIARMFASKIGKEFVNGHNPDIDFLGVFDTVAAFVPFGHGQQGTLFHDLHVSPKVLQARHAVSIDEDRAAFAPNLMNARDGIVEMWFPGNHADVGGGYEARGLADVSLRWMVHEAMHCGLTFEPVGDPVLPTKPHREKFPLRRKKRRVGVMIDGEWTDELPILYSTAIAQ